MTVRYADDAVHVEVVDDGHARPTGRADQPGHGLSGMRERVSTHGGELFAGPLADGGFAVRARRPVREGSAPPQQATVVEDGGTAPSLRDVVVTCEPEPRLRVLIADDPTLVRASFRMILEAVEEISRWWPRQQTAPKPFAWPASCTRTSS